MSSSPEPSDRASSPAAAEAGPEQRAVKRRRVEFQDAIDARGQQAENGSAIKAFVPPVGLKKVAADTTLEEFSLDALKRRVAAGCELWAVRIPDGVKLRHLDNLEITRPSKRHSKGSEKVGTYQTKKKGDYDVYSVGEEAGESAVGAGEMLGFTALVGENRTKQYVTAPVPISRHIVLQQSLSFPSRELSAEQDSDAEQMQSRHQQPEGLEGFYAPYGFNTKPSIATRAEDELVTLPPKTADGLNPPKKSKGEKKKKRKSELDSSSQKA